MKTHASMTRRGASVPATLTLICMAWLGLASTTLAQPSAPLADPTLDELRTLLSAPSARTRGFRPAIAPSRDGACALGDAVGKAGMGSRRLDVVSYGGTGVPSVNLAIQFGTGSDEVASASQRTLDRLITLLKEPGMAAHRFAIAGHTDATGNPQINLQLSCARAIAVRRYLLAHGVAADRVSAYGFGSSKPLEEGVVESAINRRVEIRRAE